MKKFLFSTLILTVFLNPPLSKADLTASDHIYKLLGSGEDRNSRGSSILREGLVNTVESTSIPQILNLGSVDLECSQYCDFHKVAAVFFKHSDDALRVKYYIEHSLDALEFGSYSFRSEYFVKFQTVATLSADIFVTNLVTQEQTNLADLAKQLADESSREKIKLKAKLKKEQRDSKIINFKRALGRYLPLSFKQKVPSLTPVISAPISIIEPLTSPECSVQSHPSLEHLEDLDWAFERNPSLYTCDSSVRKSVDSRIAGANYTVSLTPSVNSNSDRNSEREVSPVGLDNPWDRRTTLTNDFSSIDRNNESDLDSILNEYWVEDSAPTSEY
jgi:hypothetical protein